MYASAHSPITFEVIEDGHLGSAARHLVLRPSGDGWSLLTPEGEVVFRGLGRSGRRQCLEFASAVGALAVIS